MGLPAVSKKMSKKEKNKKSTVLNGKIQKKKGKQNSSLPEGVGAAKSKLNKEKKKSLLLIKQEPESQTSPPSKKLKSVTAPKPISSSDSATPSKLGKKNKAKKSKKGKNENKNSKTVNEASSSPKPGKKSQKNKKGGAAEGAPTNGSNAPGMEKVKKPLTKEQEEKVLARRKEKHIAWENTVDLILENKKIAKTEASLIKKCKKYDRLPLWKKNFFAWVKADPNYQDPKHKPLIAKVYKLLKTAERKASKVKRQQSTGPVEPKVKSAIERCTQLTAGTDVPSIKKEAPNTPAIKKEAPNTPAKKKGKTGAPLIKKEKPDSPLFKKGKPEKKPMVQKDIGGKNKPKQKLKGEKLTEPVGKNKGKFFGKRKQ